jgi:hypothetical protein
MYIVHLAFLQPVIKKTSLFGEALIYRQIF